MEICSASPLLFSKPLGSMYILLLDNLAILEIHSQMQLEIGGMKVARDSRNWTGVFSNMLIRDQHMLLYRMLCLGYGVLKAKEDGYIDQLGSLET